jgi:hypothetical protein
MSELKYKVGDIAGPFEIVCATIPEQKKPYRISANGFSEWFSESFTRSIFDHYAKSELLEKKAESQRKTIAYWKKKFDGEVQSVIKARQENDVLYESNVELRGANDELKTGIEKCLEVNNKAWELKHHVVTEELKTVKSHLDLRIKGIEALEVDSKKNRIEIELLKADHASIWDEYNTLDQSRKHSTVLAWIGWIFFFIAIFGMIFFKGN